MFSTKTRVLVVDDMLTMRKVVSKILRDVGFTDIVEAKDGVEAWKEMGAAEKPFGLVISDWNMPNCSGIDFLRRVRADQRFKKTPFLLVTAEAEHQQVAEALKAGVDQYVVKPFNQQSLVAKLEMVHRKYSGIKAS